ncbi:kinesin-like protein KIN-12E [Aristolochia californica]|uniref:kinesin-like protein KIN-12E n=1 Tax=Aristolochia californica TaxID=171875 RepID=UPI0035DCE5B6
MPTFSEAASAFRNRLRFQEPADSEPVRSSPALFRSASKDNFFQTKAAVVEKDGEADESEMVVGSSAQTFELQEDPSFWKDHNVQVVIRIRPLSSSEISLQGYNRCVKQDSCQTITWTGHPESRFTFDLVADEAVSQEKLFKVAGLPMVENCVAGYNSCMFAYGQTGSGKTHTMLGDIEGGTRRHSVNCGMTPRVFEYLFSRIQKEKEAKRDEKLRFICKISFLEIYNEQILDLLDPSSINVQIREDAKKGVYVENLTEIEVSSARDVIQQLVQGAANRKVASTNMNRASSRSHSVFTCVIESKWESQGVTHHRFARLNLVDLAGSERQKSSGAEGERLKEATNINKSLSTLGLVIMNLVSISNGKSLHVPYRDSKLTFLLQDSLGGNSKTTIIANITPSNCCALETLSTLKFAQRAKFIRNNAVVNEDASGDVLAMRLQIQQLKKEVDRLRAFANGVERQDTDNWSLIVPSSPGLFKWEGVHTSLSPHNCGKTTQKKEFDAALVGALRRIQEKEIELEASAAESQAAVQLAKQREEEIQSLKMRLRFREAGIKRLEAVSLGKISAETHLLQENGELLRAIEVLRNQVNRNQEVTRFAMENLRLNEEIRQLKLFYEDGELERMNEQIKILQNKLLEALDWKLVHEKEPEIVQNQTSTLGTPVRAEDNLLISNEEPSASWGTFGNEEIEFLRVEAIQNEKEITALRQNLSFCLEAKEKLERHVDELVLQLEKERKSPATERDQQHQVTIADTTTMEVPTQNDQTELQIMVNAIAASTQQEAEAHETAIVLAKENEELRTKLKILVEDNNKLIELYEGAVVEANIKKVGEDDNNNSKNVMEVDSVNSYHEDDKSEVKDVENLEHQLQEMHEENEKLMELYEKAMQERDEFKRMLAEVQKGSDPPEMPVKVDQVGKPTLIDDLTESGVAKVTTQELDLLARCDQGKESEEKLNLAWEKLDMSDGKLLYAAKALAAFGHLEKASTLVKKLTREIEALNGNIEINQQEISVLKFQSAEIHGRKVVMDKKLSAIKMTLLNFASSVDYWEGREARARARLDASSHFVTQKKEELSLLQAQKDEIGIAQANPQQSEVELRNQIGSLKSKLQDVENQRKTEKVLFVIDNLEPKDVPTQRNWHLGKAGELLKCEEERTKLPVEFKKTREKLASVQKEILELKRKSEELDSEIQTVTLDIKKGSGSVEEAEVALKNVTRQKDVLLELRETGRTEMEKLIVEYQNVVFDLDLKEAEITLCDEELLNETRRLEELRNTMVAETQKWNQVLKDGRVYIDGNVEEQLGDVKNSICEAKSILLGDNR